jgi:hypothetical protein
LPNVFSADRVTKLHGDEFKASLQREAEVFKNDPGWENHPSLQNVWSRLKYHR